MRQQSPGHTGDGNYRRTATGRNFVGMSRRLDPGPELVRSESGRAAVLATDVTIYEAGRVLLPRCSFDVTAGSLYLLAGASPAGRMHLAHALTGRLPQGRVSLGGRLAVFGRTSPTGIAAVTLLALPWRIRGETDVAGRRLAALAWVAERLARNRDPEHLLVAMTPGLEGLEAVDAARVTAAATELVADHGVTLILTTDASTRRPNDDRSANISLIRL